MVQERDKQINVRVYDTTRQKWQSHVQDKSEYGSVSELIRISVNQKISEDNDDLNPWDVLSDVMDEIQSLKQNQTNIQNLVQEGIDEQLKIDDVERELKNLQKSMIDSDYLDDVYYGYDDGKYIIDPQKIQKQDESIDITEKADDTKVIDDDDR